MTRKQIEVVIDAPGRDHGKAFLITEMPATQSEKWATRALLALMRSGVDIGDALGLGMSGLVIVGLKALGGVSYGELEPLLDEMWAQIQILPNAKDKKIRRELIEDDVEEIATRFHLRKAVMDLHTDFFTRAASSNTLGQNSQASRATSGQ